MPKPDTGTPAAGPSIRKIPISSLGEFVDRVTPDAPDAVTGRRRDTGVYRGGSDTDAPLLTTLDRLGGTHPPHTKADLEEHVLRNYIRYSRPHVRSNTSNDWEELFSAQHHGVPTRLLDWTYSPLVAAFFATRPCEGAEHERVVWRLDWQKIHRMFRFPSLALLPRDLDALFDAGGRTSPWQVFVRDREAAPFACLVEPPSLDERIVAQAAVFTMCSDKWHSFDQFLQSHGLADALTKYVFPPESVAKIRDQLDLVGVDERRLFPDLDGVAAAIRRYYA
jgi:hypothetical protein